MYIEEFSVLFLQTYPDRIGKYLVKYVRDLTVGYDNSQLNNKPVREETSCRD